MFVRVAAIARPRLSAGHDSRLLTLDLSCALQAVLSPLFTPSTTPPPAPVVASLAATPRT